MATVLILGGTAWLGGEVAARAVAAGHDVTCLARGGAGSVPPGAAFASADRTEPGAYAVVADRTWDLVLDVSRQPAQVRSALAALSGTARHWIFVSTLSVYAEHSMPGADESAELMAPVDGDVATPENYGEGKVACERASRDALGDRLLVARPGLIVGYGDPSDRFGYWPWRFARDPDAPVLVPGPLDAPSDVIGVRDLAAWLLAAGLDAVVGTANAIGPQRPLGDVLAACRRAAGHRGEVVVADPDWLLAQGVEPWMGPRSLPLWTPGADYAGFSLRQRSTAVAAGLRDSSIDDLATEALRWEREQDRDRVRRAGLTDAEQFDLIEAWTHR